HLWATILNAEQQGETPELPGSGRLELEYVDSEVDAEELYYDHDGDYEEEYDTPPLTLISKKSKGGKIARGWQAELQAMGKLPEPPKIEDVLASRQNRVYYIVDVVRSADSGDLVVQLYEQTTLKNGSWGKLKSLAANRHMLE